MNDWFFVCASQSLNQVVLWDKIVRRGENAKLNLKDMKSKYFFFDDGNGLRLDAHIQYTPTSHHIISIWHF